MPRPGLGEEKPDQGAERRTDEKKKKDKFNGRCCKNISRGIKRQGTKVMTRKTEAALWGKRKKKNCRKDEEVYEKKGRGPCLKGGSEY